MKVSDMIFYLLGGKNMGGYKIIDLKNKSITTTGVTIDGIYKEIEGSYRKPLLLTHIVINGVEKNDAFVNVVVQTSIYKFSLYGYSWEINSSNVVKITA